VLKGVIFDFDGVLVDSERAHFEGFRVVLSEDAGIEIRFDEYTDHYLAYDDHGGIRRALERHGRGNEEGTVERLAIRKKKVFADLLPRIGFLPGAVELIEALAARGVPLAIASGARRVEIEHLLDARGLKDRFRGIVSADDVVNFKPHPEPYLRARALLHATETADGVVAFEDSPAGMASARAADLRVVGVTNSYPRAKLGLAHHVVDSLAELDVEGVAALARGAGASG
jgi:HAD superfamily hydrolase (TIGR01509 family)